MTNAIMTIITNVVAAYNSINGIWDT